MPICSKGKEENVSEAETLEGGEGEGEGILWSQDFAGIFSHFTFPAEGSSVGRRCGGRSRPVGRGRNTLVRALLIHLGPTLAGGALQRLDNNSSSLVTNSS